jgi:hypothetical protein
MKIDHAESARLYCVFALDAFSRQRASSLPAVCRQVIPRAAIFLQVQRPPAGISEIRNF